MVLILFSIPFFLYALNIMRWNYSNNYAAARWVAFALGCVIAWQGIRDLLAKMKKFDAEQQRLQTKTIAQQTIQDTKDVEQRWYLEREERRRQIAEEWRTTDYKLPTLEQFQADVMATEQSSARFVIVNRPPPAVTLHDMYRLRFIEIDRSNQSVADMKRIYAQTVDELRGRRDEFQIAEDTYFKSTFIVAPPGRGKTTLLRSLFYDRLELVKQNKASIIILDSKGQFADEISHLKLFAKGQPLHAKLILINPDPDFPLALNPLELDPIPSSATDGKRGLAQSRTIELIEYLISVFVPGEQSNPQQRFLRAVLKALLEVFPNPTFEDLYQLLVQGYEPFEDKISKMKDRSFFSKDQFYGGTVKPTRESLITRIGFMRDNYALASIIKSRESRLNLADAMDSSKVIIINNGIDLLGDEGCEFFGRFFLYLMRKAAERRRPIPEHNKMPVYVICDEAHNVIKRDDKISRTIQDLRSHKIAMTFAIQDLSEIHSNEVKAALFSCGIIFANTKEDAPALVHRLRVKDEYPLDFINRPIGQFATYVFGQADDAIALSVTPPPYQPSMTDHEFAEVTHLMHERFCVRGATDAGPSPRAHPGSPGHNAPIDDNKYDDRYDLEETITTSPTKAKAGYVHTVKCPNGQTQTLSINHKTKDGARFCFKGMTRIRRPDGRMGNYWVQVSIPRPAADDIEDF